MPTKNHGIRFERGKEPFSRQFWKYSVWEDNRGVLPEEAKQRMQEKRATNFKAIYRRRKSLIGEKNAPRRKTDTGHGGEIPATILWNIKRWETLLRSYMGETERLKNVPLFEIDDDEAEKSRHPVWERIRDKGREGSEQQEW